MSSCSHSVTHILAPFSDKIAHADPPLLLDCLYKVLTCMSSPSVSCKITSSVKRTHIFFPCFNPTLSFSTGSFLYNSLSLTTRIHWSFLWIPSLQKVLSFYSIIKISPDYKSKSIFSVICALVTRLILITNVHLCFCWIVRSLEQDSCLLSCLSSVYHAQVWSTTVGLLLYEY